MTGAALLSVAAVICSVVGVSCHEETDSKMSHEHQGHSHKLVLTQVYVLSQAVNSSRGENLFDRLKRVLIRQPQTQPFDWPGRRVCIHPSVGNAGQSTGQTGSRPFGC